MKKIDESEKEIQGELHKYADGLRSRVTNEKQTLNELVITKDKQLKTFENRLQSKCHELETVIESNQGNAIVSTELEIGGSLQDDPDNLLPSKILDFKSGKFETTVMDNIFGSLKSINAPEEQLKHEFKVLKSYTTDLMNVDQLCIINHHVAWVCNASNQRLHKMCLNEQISANTISLTGEIKILTESGVIKPLFSFAPLLTRGIHVNRNNDIILGFQESGNSTAQTQISSKILILQMDGKQKHSIEFDQHGKRLFTIPGRIKTNINNDIVVLDSLSGRSSRVMVLGQGGDLKWIYQGNTKINKTDNGFHAMGVVTTATGNIIVADHSCDTLHFLSMSGELLSYSIMVEQGVNRIISLDIDNNMQLWVGCGSSGKKSDAAKIHILKII
ncbi:TRIM2_3 [Mytilus edulis]|uniref:TRIM2_3 n=1 Tax=Mytilus edulis TaxID=6550 RepID=A0A8S3UA65_MYTED|nr:TRIM2_3 [Mytilus edulis]